MKEFISGRSAAALATAGVLAGFFGAGVVPAMAAISYERSGGHGHGPVHISVTMDSAQDFPAANTNYWWISIDRIVWPQTSADLALSECVPSSTLAHTFDFALEPQAYYAVNLWADTDATCLTSVADAIDYDNYETNSILEGDNSLDPATFVIHGPSRQKKLMRKP